MESNLDACQAAVSNLEEGQGNVSFVIALLLLEIAVQLSELRQTLENKP